ncbi:uncharacterized protein LOC103480267 [Poecilia reticulata]|uniref:uncharacterized protein LOC103480267 n=1 Tax=Poecilia reticulata TaxID=8081 RepID=UPI0007EA9127|nr:PREDICTED: uncharacterized protein LOC103480267 [Poecilia reticulata]
MRHSLLCMLGYFCIKATLTADRTTTLAEVSHRVSVILHPSWPQIYREETVILRCQIQEAGGTEWTYEWKTTNRKSLIPCEYMNFSATEAHSGEYSCRGRREGFTPWSEVIKLTVSSPPQPVLSVSPSWLNPGASVTLSCEVQPQDAGWRFYWYKAVPDPFSRYTYELLPGSTNGTEQNSFIINGPTRTAGFGCRAGRGEPKFYTYYSEPKFIWSADPGPAASLSVNPDRVQHFRSESVTLSCEGNSAEWRVMKFTETELSDCSKWGRISGSKCVIVIDQNHTGVYWCESGTGEFSNTVNITARTVSGPVSSLRLVLLIIGPISGILLIILLLSLWRCTRLFLTERRSQSSTTSHAAHQSGSQVYSALLQGWSQN